MKDKIFVPEKICLEEMMKEQPFQYFKIESAYYLISLIAKPKVKKEYENDNFNRLLTKLLEKQVWNYKEYLNWFAEIGIIEIDHSYQIKKKSKGYKIQDNYFSILIKYQLTDKDLIKRINKGYTVDFLGNTNTTVFELAKYFDENLTLSSDALVFVEDQYHNSMKGIEDKCRYNYSQSICHQYQNSAFHCTRDTTTYRVHSTYSGTPTDIRFMVTHASGLIKGIDIVNSQPFFSLVLFEPWFWEKSLNHILSIYNPTILCTQPISSIPPSFMFEKIIKTTNSPDVLLYRQLVLDGQIYNWLGDLINKNLPHIKETPVDRNGAKKLFFPIFYSKDFHNGKTVTAVKELLNREIPDVMSVFHIIKSRHHQALSHLLQRIESFVVIDHFAPTVWNDYVIFTLHDSVACLEHDVDFIKNAYKKKIEEITGFEPILTVK